VARAIPKLHPHPEPVAGVHPTAVLGPGVVIGKGASIGPLVSLGAGVHVGDGTAIGAGSVIGDYVHIGRRCVLHSRVTLYHEVTVGNYVTLHSGCVIGADGFGFVLAGEVYEKFPQVGRVVIGDHVEIGANSCVDRAALGVTSIGEGSKLDNLIMIAHNCQIGRHCVIAGQTGLAGSVVLEDSVVLAGQVGLGDHTRVGTRARMGARSGTGSAFLLEGGVDYGGAPAKPVREWAREIHALSRLARGPRKQGKDD
jgi:UDP-3-O-[3-hydroxymyristoyl] glucosamine N-acyltransferase